MVKNRNFVVTCLQHWDVELGCNAIDIAIEISKNNRVLFLNTPIDYLSYLKGDPIKYRQQVIHREKPPLRQINDNLWLLDCPFKALPLNKLKINSIFDWANKYNNRKIAGHILRETQKLGMDRLILFCDNDVYRSFYMKEMLQPDIMIYYRRDNLGNVAYWKKQVKRLEPLLCAKSDLVVANSDELAEAVKPYHPNTYGIGQGLNLESYDANKKYPVPTDIAAIKRPVIGYTGWITSLRLDADLIYSVASQRPQYSFVLVGAEDDVFRKHPVHTLDNVHFLGNKNPSEVPDYIASFNVCFNPQLINETTIGNNPRKIDEYLALGKPTVATKTKTMSIFEECVRNCLMAEEYVHALDDALNNDSDEKRAKRIALANSHSWENNVAKIYEHINRVSGG